MLCNGVYHITFPKQSNILKESFVKEKGLVFSKSAEIQHLDHHRNVERQQMPFLDSC